MRREGWMRVAGRPASQNVEIRKVFLRKGHALWPSRVSLRVVTVKKKSNETRTRQANKNKTVLKTYRAEKNSKHEWVLTIVAGLCTPMTNYASPASRTCARTHTHILIHSWSHTDTHNTRAHTHRIKEGRQAETTKERKNEHVTGKKKRETENYHSCWLTKTHFPLPLKIYNNTFMAVCEMLADLLQVNLFSYRRMSFQAPVFPHPPILLPPTPTHPKTCRLELFPFSPTFCSHTCSTDICYTLLHRC